MIRGEENRMKANDILVVIPHSGIVIPAEIPPESLSGDFAELAQNVDWYTNWLYDFRDILGNRQLVFPYCSLILEANRRPDLIEDSVPLTDVRGRAVYRAGCEPDPALRARLSARYLDSFHGMIEEAILGGASFLFDGHSTVTARGVADDQIELMNYQHSRLDRERVVYCPDSVIETYARELRKRLPGVRITVNASDYHSVHGHVCAAHSINAQARVGPKVPAFIQETNEHLYKNSDRTPNVTAIDRLRRAFAESLGETVKAVRASEKGGNP